MPPPNPIDYMSGNFDHPPASDHTPASADQIVLEILDNRVSIAEISPSGELVRAIDRYNRAAGNSLANQTTSRESSADILRRMSAESNDRRRRAANRNSQQASSSSSGYPSASSAPPPAQARPGSQSHSYQPSRTTSHRNHLSSIDRRRPRLSSVQRVQDGGDASEDGSVAEGLDTLENARRSLLDEDSMNLRALLDSPVPILSSPTTTNRIPLEPDMARRKRRKLDHNTIQEPKAPAFRYGYHGEVVPGRLNMEIVSCDGGIFTDAGGLSEYAAENVLKNDDSVYCTRDNRCNLVLRHRGGTAFCLKELIIKAPPRGFTAPVQEGMVFISMTEDDLLTRTAQYQIQYSPSSSESRRRQPNNEPLPILSIRHHNDGSMTTAQARARRLVYLGQNDDDDCEYRMAQIPSDFTTINAPPFHVTTECSDAESENSPIATRRRQTHRMSAYLDDLEADSGSSSDLSGPEDTLLNIRRRPRIVHNPRRETASQITLAAEAAQVTMQEAVRAVGGELMAPHARFFIERDKSKCTVKFDPPVSGRFILLKMWSPHRTPSGNIDIQSIVANGFSGPRFFPATQLR